MFSLKANLNSTSTLRKKAQSWAKKHKLLKCSLNSFWLHLGLYIET